MTLNFVHSGAEFTLDVTPSDESDYPVVHADLITTGHQGGICERYIIVSEFKVKGTVTIGDDNQPVDSARVYVEGNESIFTLPMKKENMSLGRFRAK